MKRRILPLALALVCALPLAAQADGVRPTVEITDNHGIHQYTDAAGDSYEIAGNPAGNAASRLRHRRPRRQNLHRRPRDPPQWL